MKDIQNCHGPTVYNRLRYWRSMLEAFPMASFFVVSILNCFSPSSSFSSSPSSSSRFFRFITDCMVFGAGPFLGAMGWILLVISLYGLAAHISRAKNSSFKLPLGMRYGKSFSRWLNARFCERRNFLPAAKFVLPILISFSLFFSFFFLFFFTKCLKELDG